MLPGFPKKITTTRIKRGLHRIEREDGYVVIAQRGDGQWWANSAWTAKSLRVIQFDMRCGYTGRDQVAAACPDVI